MTWISPLNPVFSFRTRSGFSPISPIESDSKDGLLNLKMELNEWLFLLARNYEHSFPVSFPLCLLRFLSMIPLGNGKHSGQRFYKYRPRSSALGVPSDSPSSSKSSMRHPEFCCLFRASAKATIDRFICGFKSVNTPQLDRPFLFPTTDNVTLDSLVVLSLGTPQLDRSSFDHKRAFQNSSPKQKKLISVLCSCLCQQKINPTI
ncbi:Protein of unknown function [Pyronema omphalodes CBS 100304]|uniref:Uncharacterized protein n=1 Tax=Pyronema omphalodes (strain CBS 100304) TaxID=1076935 RepID=U4L7E1_PYROM|nr:Protein of unknown function [Pyronema omphalodes CBS 100304]